MHKPGEPAYPLSTLALAVGALLGIGATAQAQVLDEILVTAERRETALQDTPISIAVFSAETMELKGIETLEDVATFTPNLDLKGSRFSGNSEPYWQIRGLSGGGGVTGQRAAGLYIDGIYMPRTSGPFLNVLDVERIEVLRGPQGTLFGRNSTGGAIRIFSRKPGPEQEAYVKLGVGNFERQDFSAMVNVPISDTVMFRAQGASLSEEGYVRRGTQLLGGQDDVIGRFQLGLLPSENVAVNLNLSYNKAESDGGAQDLTIWDMRPDQNFQGQYADWVSDFLEAAGQPRLDVYNDPRIVLDDYTMPDWCFLDDPNPDWDALCEQYNNSEFTQLDATVEWQINDRLTLTSISGVSQFESEGVTDSQLLGFTWSPSGTDSDVLYQELQLNATLGDDRVDLVGGLTYFHEEGASPADANLSVVGTSVFPANPGTPPNSWSGLRSQNIGTTRPEADSYGLFVNAAINVTDRFRVTPGVRWAYDEQFIEQIAYRSDNFVPFVGDFTQFHTSEDWDQVDWRLTLDHDLGENHMVYLTLSEAYRAGAYAPPPVPQNRTGDEITAALAAVPPFTPPETVENSEIGVRTEWLDGRLRLNLTYFDMLYTDRQGARAVNDPTQLVGFRIVVVNTGDVDVSGLELEGQFAVTDDFMLDFSAGNVDTDVHDVCANNGDFFFPGPVEQSYALGGRWNKLMRGGESVTFSLNYGYTGEQETHSGGTLNPTCPVSAQFFFDSRYTNEDYGLWNGRIRYDNGNGRWNAALFVNNITDEVYSNNSSRAGGGFWDSGNRDHPSGVAVPPRSVVQQVRGRPREYGVTFQYNFGGDRAGSR